MFLTVSKAEKYPARGTCSIYPTDHSGCGLGQWEEALHSNASSYWLSPYPKCSLMSHKHTHGLLCFILLGLCYGFLMDSTDLFTHIFPYNFPCTGSTVCISEVILILVPWDLPNQDETRKNTTRMNILYSVYHTHIVCLITISFPIWSKS